jgi:hypothetical protein
MSKSIAAMEEPDLEAILTELEILSHEVEEMTPVS